MWRESVKIFKLTFKKFWSLFKFLEYLKLNYRFSDLSIEKILKKVIKFNSFLFTDRFIHLSRILMVAWRWPLLQFSFSFHVPFIEFKSQQTSLNNFFWNFFKSRNHNLEWWMTFSVCMCAHNLYYNWKDYTWALIFKSWLVCCQ